MNSEEITRLVEAGLPAGKAIVRSDDDTHFEAVVISPEFEGKSRLQRHQMVYAALGGSIRADIHALSIRAYTPGEWRADDD
ncbi:MAG TPA: BolA/IbaG family iron-sulfur metabolism protein [Gammaproteobacteria bacterium]|nr:BolA/IbaG family iron-sulfur metabolism protein [Gammaproteobacteria bacterium]